MLAVPGPSRGLRPETIEQIKTPALVYDLAKLDILLSYGLDARKSAGCRLLYAVKAMCLEDILDRLGQDVDGFAVSSLFEARLVSDQFPGSTVHYTSPGIHPGEVEELSLLCDYMSVNSRPQVERFGAPINRQSSLGIRVNTRISKVADKRYDPCRLGSKLGIPVEAVSELIESAPDRVEGLHIHTNSDSADLSELLENAHTLVRAIPKGFKPKWVNLGGGYLFEDAPLDPLIDAVGLVRRNLGSEVFLEPGAGLVRAAGFLVGTILDIFDVDGERLAVLDTTVNHMPEVLEFDYQPDVMSHEEEGPFKYMLAGSTCLAGDLFGTYRFANPLEIGQKLVFEEAGAYTLVKAHRFNGVNLPEVGVVNADGQYRVCKSFSYRDFASYWMTNA